MPRVARKKSNSGFYHVVLRGINRETIFFDQEDREVFLNRLKIEKKKINFEIVAFCLMTNHIHLLLKTDDKLGEIMKGVLSSYVYWYNSKYERVGHLFQERYKSEPIETAEYLLCCTRYILQNPVKAKICKSIWEYKWSSASAMIKENLSIVDSKTIKEMLGGQMREFLEMQNSDKFLEWESKTKLTDVKLKEKIEKELEIANINDLLELNKTDLVKGLRKIMLIQGANILQVSRITGVPYNFIRRLE